MAKNEQEVGIGKEGKPGIRKEEKATKVLKLTPKFTNLLTLMGVDTEGRKRPKSGEGPHGCWPDKVL